MKPYHYFIFMLLILFSNSLLAQERFALLIGNTNYRADPLKNPGNDAQDLGRKLKSLGFNTRVVLNADQHTMERAINDFQRQLRTNRNNVGLFYFSGHGLQVDGNNFLIPINAMSSVQSKSQIRSKTVPSDYVLGSMSDAENGLNIVIIDACRNNPFKSFTRSARRGLTRDEYYQDTLVAYATSPGKLALDGAGRNSPYVESLLRQISRKNLPIELMLKAVGSEVRQLTNGEQSPWYSASIGKRFSFNDGGGGTGGGVTTVGGGNPPPSHGFTQGFRDVLAKNNNTSISKNQYCAAYANTAIRQNQRRNQITCRHAVAKPNRWSQNRDPQYQWCLSVDRKRTRIEAVKREEYIQSCLKR